MFYKGEKIFGIQRVVGNDGAQKNREATTAAFVAVAIRAKKPKPSDGAFWAVNANALKSSVAFDISSPRAVSAGLCFDVFAGKQPGIRQILDWGLEVHACVYTTKRNHVLDAIVRI